MERVRRFADELRAEQAAAYLRAHGVAAEVVGHHTQRLLGMGQIRNPWMGFDVVVQREGREQAELLLEEMERSTPQFEEGWEDEASRVDLSMLDESLHGVSCPECGEGLALDAALEACPVCGVEVDVVELVVQAHGPEALDAKSASVGSAARRETRDRVACGECGSDLSGLPVRGRCPGCGALFDKQELHRRRHP